MFAQRGFPFLGHSQVLRRLVGVENKVKVSVCSVWCVRWNNKAAVFSASVLTLITHLHRLAPLAPHYTLCLSSFPLLRFPHSVFRLASLRAMKWLQTHLSLPHWEDRGSECRLLLRL